MSFNPLLSAVLRGHWLIDKSFADSQLPLIAKMLSGEETSFAHLFNKDEDPLERKIAKLQHFGPGAISIYSVNPWTELSEIQQESIAMVNIKGPLMKAGGYCSYGMEDITQLVNRLSNADNISALLVNIDSPGGQVYGTAMLGDALSAFSNKKPSIAIIQDGYAASAGYWLASSCNEIYVTQKTSKVGSIGVYTSLAALMPKFYEERGIKFMEIYAPQSTDKNKQYKDAIERDDTTAMEEDLSMLAETFINVVAIGRAGKIKGDTWSTGKMFYADEALKVGLIDGIKSMDQVVQRMNKLIADRSTSKNSTSNMANTKKAGAAAEGAATEENATPFSRTLKASGAESFTVTDEGFALSEENLNGIEAALQTAEENANSMDQIDTLTATVAANDATIATQSTTIATQASRITALEAEVKELGADASDDKGTVLTTAGDNPPGGAAKVRSYNDPNSAINKKADRRMGLRK
jgi:protease IV